MSGRSVNLTTLFLGRLRPPKRLTSTSYTYFRQYMTTALLEKAEEETKVCCLYLVAFCCNTIVKLFVVKDLASCLRALCFLMLLEAS